MLRSDDTSFVIEAMIRRGQPVPEDMLPPEPLPEGLIFYWEAFWDLSTCRPFAFSEGPIPWTAVEKYGSRYKVENLKSFWTIIQKLDHAYLTERNKQRKSRETRNAKEHTD